MAAGGAALTQGAGTIGRIDFIHGTSEGAIDILETCSRYTSARTLKVNTFPQPIMNLLRSNGDLYTFTEGVCAHTINASLKESIKTQKVIINTQNVSLNKH